MLALIGRKRGSSGSNPVLGGFHVASDAHEGQTTLRAFLDYIDLPKRSSSLTPELIFYSFVSDGGTVMDVLTMYVRWIAPPCSVIRIYCLALEKPFIAAVHSLIWISRITAAEFRPGVYILSL